MNRIHFIKKLQDQKRSLQKKSVECFKNQPKIAYYVQKPPFKIIKPKTFSLCVTLFQPKMLLLDVVQHTGG